MSEKTRPAHLYKPGQSGNPAGRPGGYKGVAAMIRAETQDCWSLVRYALDVWQGIDPQTGAPVYSHADRWAAHKWLTERALGSVMQIIDLHNTNEPSAFAAVNLDRLSPKDVATLEEILERALTGEVIDV